MITAEQQAFIARQQARLYHPDQLEVRVFSGDVYTRLSVHPVPTLACDPDGNERIDGWPERGVALSEIEASDAAITATLRCEVE